MTTTHREGLRLAAHGARLPAQQPAHRFLLRARRRRAAAQSPIAWRPASARGARWIRPSYSRTGDGGLRYVLGSPGGPAIILYNVKTIVALIDWGLDPAQASALANFGGDRRCCAARAGRRTWIPSPHRLQAMGHEVAPRPPDQRRAHHRRDRMRARRRRRPTPRRRGARGLMPRNANQTIAIRGAGVVGLWQALTLARARSRSDHPRALDRPVR